MKRSTVRKVWNVNDHICPKCGVMDGHLEDCYMKKRSTVRYYKLTDNKVYKQNATATPNAEMTALFKIECCDGKKWMSRLYKVTLDGTHNHWGDTGMNIGLVENYAEKIPQKKLTAELMLEML